MNINIIVKFSVYPSEDRARQLKLEIHIWQQKNKVWMDNEDAINLNNKVTLDKDFYGINNQ